MKEKWTLDNIPDLSNKVFVVTGANTGLGKDATKAFASHNASVVMACRNIEKAQTAKEDILKEYPNAKLDIIELDLSDFESITNFANTFKNKYKKLDVLLNNAGIMNVPYGLTKDGLELQNGVNHFGHFALTAQLFDIIKDTPKSRIVSVSSMAHKFGKMDFKNPLFKDGKCSPFKSYGRSKLSNLLFIYKLSNLLEEHKTDTIAVAAHPGISATELVRYSKKSPIKNFFINQSMKLSQPSEMGALPEIRACVDENVKNGDYYGPSGFLEMRGFPVLVPSNKRSHIKADQDSLWDLSQSITHQTFDF
jgi:NAD(P)-dependent dehydrogenase (short-subunit alcohol dehydrogenase family)